jgi:hypothetical protein
MIASRFPGLRWLWLFVVAGLSACFLVRKVTVVELDRGSDSVQVRTPVKAHLIDGATVVYPQGVLVLRNRLVGEGTWYDLTLKNPATIKALTLDSVVGLESYQTHIDAGSSIAISLLATAGTVGIGVGIACAIDPKCFGSCPTYYSDSAGTPVLEAEGFSYSIAPLFEARDVDRLRGRPDASGAFRLEIRNEAFETHYINHLELLEATHAPGEYVLPDNEGNPLGLGDQRLSATATDRAGRDIRDLVNAAEGRVYSTAPAVMDRVASGELEDWIELTFENTRPNDSVAVVLRLRNSLLNTVLLYDIMLGDPGARSIDWQARHLSRIGPALELGAWYGSKMGMAIEVWRGGAWVPIARVKDTGPVAWKELAIPLATTGTELRFRLRFPADNWRIDRVALAHHMARPAIRAVPLAQLTSLDGNAESDAMAGVLANDERYLQTQAGQAFIARWEVGAAPAGRERSFLLASQGYYIEWVRRGWIASNRDTTTFRPDDTALRDAILRWRQAQDSLELRFFATRVPVR